MFKHCIRKLKEGGEKMKERVKVALVQMDSGLVMEKEKNVQNHINKIKELGKQEVDLILFPELSVSGYIQETTHENRRKYWELGAEDVPGPSTDRIQKAATDAGTHVIFGIAERSNIPMLSYNSAVLISPEGFVGVNRKIHLPLAEKDYFLQGTEPKVFQTRLGKIGTFICYEMMFPEPARMLAVLGAEILAFIGFVGLRSKEGTGGGVGIGEEKNFLFNVAPRIRAIENQTHLLNCCGAGIHYMGERTGSWTRFGQSKIIDSLGNIVAESKSIEEDLVIGEITNEVLVKGRAAYPMLNDRVPFRYSTLTNSDFGKCD